MGKLDDLVKKFDALSPADQLRTAAGCLDETKVDIGIELAKRTLERLQLAKLLAK